jgi:D-lyxose ketol-isomerase
MINNLINEAKQILAEYGIHLPPFAFWSPEEWESKGDECREIRECGLGWDITDFGTGDFYNTGLVVFTARNGHRDLPAYRSKTYCEKILIVRENQRTPMHYHAIKQEDIICVNGGDLRCKVHMRDDNGGLSDTEVEISLDGVRHRVPSGHTFTLSPGESITLTPGIHHEFWAAAGTGTSIVREISKVNDDMHDNYFLEAPKRYPSIEEDEAPIHPLCTEV